MGFGKWMQTFWRPLIACTYVIICLWDFIVGPTIFNVLQYLNPGQDISIYSPLTTSGGGLLHLSFGSIITMSTHGRTKEKIAEKTMS